MLCSAADAAKYYVPDDFRTVQDAIYSASTNDTILVRPGDYTVQATFNGKRLIVHSTDGPEVTILRPADQRMPIFSLINNEPIDTEIAGFTFTGYDSLYTVEPRGIILCDHFARLRIQRCIFRDNHLVRALNCVAAILVINRNVFYDNTGDFCISLWKGTASILNNTIVRCAGGILTMTTDVEVLGNIVTGCQYYGVKGTTYGLDYNDFWNNAINYGDGANPGAHDMSVNPLFVNPAAHDYHLMASSPCIDAGFPDPYFNDPDGTRNDIGRFPYQVPTGIDDPDTELPQSFALQQNYPNPFNGSTHIAFTLPAAGTVNLRVFNIRGQVVATLANRPFAAGSHDIVWDGADDGGKPVSSGVYFYRLTTEQATVTRRMVYCK